MNIDAWIATVAGSPLRALPIALIAAAGFLGLGRLAFEAAKIRWRHPAFRDLAAFAIGMDLVAFASACLSPLPNDTACFALWTLLALGAGKLGMDFMAKPPPIGKLKPGPAALLLIPLALYLGAALCPPSGWDELVYQIAIPRRWIELGARLTMPDLPYSGFPSLPQTLYWPLMRAGGGAITAKLISFSAFAAFCAGAYLLCRTRTRAFPAAALACALTLAPIASAIGKEAYAEQFIALNLVAALIAAHGARLSSRARLLPGLAAGACLAVKLTGAFPAMAAIALSAMEKEASWSGRLKKAAMAAALAALFALPFYARPALETGNPFHPYFAWLFSNSEAALESSKFHHEIGSARFGADGIPGLLSTPLLLGVPMAPFDKVNDGSFGLQLLLVYLLAALALKSGGSARRVWPFVLAATLLYLLWFATARQARFLVPAFALLLPAAAAGVSTLSKARATALAATFLALAAASFPPAALKHFALSWRALFDARGQTSIVYSGSGQGHLEAVEALLSRTRPDAKVLLLFEERTLYMPRRCAIGTPFFQSGTLTPPEKTGGLMEAIRKGAFTHVLLRSPENNPDLLPGYLQRSTAIIEEAGLLAKEGKLKPVWGGPGGYILFETGESPEAAKGAQK